MSATATRWLTVRAAAARLGISPFKMADLVRRGAVESLNLPNTRPMVSSEDLERLRKESHRPANRPAVVATA